MDHLAVRLLQISTRSDIERELRRIDAAPAQVASIAPKMLNRCLHLSGLSIDHAQVLQQELVAAGGEALLGHPTRGSQPIEAIAIGTETILQALCARLDAMPSELARLSADIKTTLSTAATPLSFWRTPRQDLPLARPLIMGILNVTPDSFSDGARYLDPQRAVERALQMVEEGADIIDIGGESTRPGAEQVPAEIECQRVVPVIEQLVRHTNHPISIDTWKGAVADAAMAAGAAIINDISGFTFDPTIAGVAARTGAAVVLMHTRGTPQTMQQHTAYQDLLGDVINGLHRCVKHAEAEGIAKERIAVDPGIGFAKNAEGNLELLRRLTELKVLGLPILVGTSRKAFIGRTLGRATGDRSYGTAATVALAVANGASILRVHDVAAMRDAALMAHAVAFGSTANPLESNCA